jgi:hypothetical protein
MRIAIITACLLAGMSVPAAAQVSIGIEMQVFPELVLVPGYPVYYAPDADSNYFFYDGYYWVYSDDRWYSSAWYNGPWDLVDPEAVPYFILRVPVGYYRRPPGYFRGWGAEQAPHWGEHWGHDWEQRRGGWNRWDRGAAPAAAPLPGYQRQYSGDRYPHRDQQPVLQRQNYNYQPRDTARRPDQNRPQRPLSSRQPPPQQQRPPTEQPRQAPVRAPEPDRPWPSGKPVGDSGVIQRPASSDVPAVRPPPGSRSGEVRRANNPVDLAPSGGAPGGGRAVDGGRAPQQHAPPQHAPEAGQGKSSPPRSQQQPPQAPRPDAGQGQRPERGQSANSESRQKDHGAGGGRDH